MNSSRWDTILLASAAALIAPLLICYSQTSAFAWDEGFHLLAAQMILRGKTPYLDFFFSQAPVNAYWNAAWMALLGESWRVPHLIAAIETSGAVYLMAHYVWRRFPIAEWRLACALLTALAFGFNTLVVTYGAVAQAYGLCLLLLTAAFRAAVFAVERGSLWIAAAAGLLSAAAADSSLLTAPALPILLGWILWQSQSAPKRWPQAGAFLAGAIAGFVPLIALMIRAPRSVIFGVFEYNMFYRALRWPEATGQNVDVLLSWIDSSHALMLLVLSIAGLWFVHNRSGWTRAQAGEFYLCFYLALGLGLLISTAHPTFERYFVLLVPFLAVLSAAGLYAIASRLTSQERASRAVLAVLVLLLFGLGKSLYVTRDDLRWSDLEAMARRVDEVTPPNASLAADESVYFLTRRLPPEGMTVNDSHKLDFPDDLARRLHVIHWDRLDQRIRAGEFYTVEIQNDDERIEKLDPKRTFRHQEEFERADCSLFWEPTLVYRVRPVP